MTTLVVLALLYLLVVNFMTVRAFRADKVAAVLQTNRISEVQLLIMCLIGGSLGSIVASRVYRHKTHKQPFRFYMFSIFALQICVLIAIVTLPLWIGTVQG